MARAITDYGGLRPARCRHERTGLHQHRCLANLRIGRVRHAFETMSKVGPAVCFFGSARISPDHRYYQAAEATAGFWPGMGWRSSPAARHHGGNNREPRRAAPLSVGCNIELPFEQKPNDYQDVMLNFTTSSAAKPLPEVSLCLCHLPGGFGTMDELLRRRRWYSAAR